ncbi:MAG TPA: TetR/AcrR family transcriptional regulator [Clostridia bacterium]
MPDQQIDLPDLSEREMKILESAIKIFSSKGYSAATTKEISQESGIAEGTLFKYFKTKKDLLRGVLVLTIRKFSSKLVLQPVKKILNSQRDDKSLENIVKELLLDRLRLAESIFPMIRVVATEALYHSDVREALRESIINPAIENFEVFFKEMSMQGLIRKDIDFKAVLRNVLGNIFMLIMQNKVLGDKITDEDIENTVKVIINGISLIEKK